MSTTHGYSKTAIFRVYRNMLARCTRPSCPTWDCYGGRGIKICDRWLYGENGKHPFLCFLEDMGEPPPGKSLDRKNNDGNYEPGNCRWATHKQQMHNMRRDGLRVKTKSSRTGTGVRGIYKTKHNSFRAMVGKTYVGSFKTLKAAIAARQEASIKLGYRILPAKEELNL